MRDSISLGKILGVPLRLHYTWFIIFVFLTVSLVLYVSGDYPIEQRIILGIITSALFFGSIIVHELAHSVLAIRNGIPVKDITQFIFRGVTQITREATRPKTELLVAIVGPLASLAMGGIFYGAYFLLAQTQQTVAASLMQWLAMINVILAVFNLVPGFPLDGGRIFRALVWQRTGNYVRATSIATKVGRGIALAFIIGGIVIIFALHLWFQGLWLVFIGWFLHDAARASYQQVLLRNALYGITVYHVMDHGSPLISRDLNLRDLVQQYILPTGRTGFPVTREAVLDGMVTLQRIKKTPKAKWDITSVQDIMTPASKLKVAHPDQDILTLLQEMSGKTVNHIPVIQEGKVIGMVNREDLTRFLRTRVDLGTKLAL
jgi:Zn-dependent protease